MISLILSENHIHYAQWETLSGSQSIDLVGSLPLKTPLSEFKPGTEEFTAMLGSEFSKLSMHIDMVGKEIILTIPDWIVHQEFITLDKDLIAPETRQYLEWISENRWGGKASHFNTLGYWVKSDKLDKNYVRKTLIPSNVVGTLKLTIAEQGAKPTWMGTNSEALLNAQEKGDIILVKSSGLSYELFYRYKQEVGWAKIRFIKNVPHIQSIRGRKRSINTLLKRLDLYINGESDWLGYDIAYINQLSAGRRKYWERNEEHADSLMLQPFDRVNISGEVSFENLSVLHLNVLTSIIGTIDKLPLINLFNEPGITQYEEGMDIPQIQSEKDGKDYSTDIDQQDNNKEDSKIKKTSVQSSMLTWILFTIAVAVFAYWIFSKEYPQTINYRDHILKLSKESYSMANSANIIIDAIPDSSLIEAKVVNMTLHLEMVRTDTLNPISFINGNEISFYQDEVLCCGGTKHIYDYVLYPNDQKADKNWLTIEDLKIIFEDYPMDTEIEDLSTTNRNFLVFDRLRIKASSKDNLIRALELSTNLSENILLRKIVITNNPEDPRVKGKLYIAVIKEPSSGFWVFNIQNTIKDIKNLIMNIDLQSIVNKIKQSFG
ncbi:MAG: hypothetical protein VX680_04275 [Candidatus Neomarinimicrobiota bacterium]|nr:hypothetical protein [Candidatus Neomarinimicrobiota bacterium]|tara:strand:- start:1351 stop:3159 length:1809 start_codon:yes stop_codon:yes gene_type:complete